MKSFLRRLARQRSSLTVTLYTRAGCHLCDDAKKPAARAAAATGAALRIVDIAGQPEYETLYGQRIPVVTVSTDGGEQVIAEGKISHLWLQRTLSAFIEES